MLFVTPLIAKESNLNFQGQKDHPVQQEMGTSRIKNTTGERGDGTIQGKNSSAEISADEILTVFDQFNELCSYLEVKSSVRTLFLFYFLKKTSLSPQVNFTFYHPDCRKLWADL